MVSSTYTLMRFLLSLTFFCFLSHSCFCQDYVPTLVSGTTWDIAIGEGMGSFRYLSYTLDCDTVEINGHSYQQLIFDDILLDCEKDVPSYVREDVEARQVFYYDELLENEILIADYSLEPGDTLVVEDGEGWFYHAVLDSVYMRTLGDRAYRYMSFNGGNYGLYEGVGNYRAGLMQSCNQFTYPSLHGHTPPAVDCNGAVSTNEQNAIPNFLYYPNPAGEYLVVRIPSNYESPDLSYQLYDMRGLLILHGKAAESTVSIELGHLATGTYLIRFTDRGSLISKQLISHNR